jgi:hypothetical protein
MKLTQKEEEKKSKLSLDIEQQRIFIVNGKKVLMIEVLE